MSTKYLTQLYQIESSAETASAFELKHSQSMLDALIAGLGKQIEYAHEIEYAQVLQLKLERILSEHLVSCVGQDTARAADTEPAMLDITCYLAPSDPVPLLHLLRTGNLNAPCAAFQ